MSSVYQALGLEERSAPGNMKTEGKRPLRQARTSKVGRTRPQKIAPAPPLAETQPLFQQSVRSLGVPTPDRGGCRDRFISEASVRRLKLVLFGRERVGSSQLSPATRTPAGLSSRPRRGKAQRSAGPFGQPGPTPGADRRLRTGEVRSTDRSTDMRAFADPPPQRSNPKVPHLTNDALAHSPSLVEAMTVRRTISEVEYGQQNQNADGRRVSSGIYSLSASRRWQLEVGSSQLRRPGR